MKEAIRARAIELGFDDCRVTTAAPPHSAPQFQQWLAQGRQGEMAYLERNAAKRIAPVQVLAGARSVVALAASYFSEESRTTVTSPRAESARNRGAIARYARYHDYHNILAERLRVLSDFINGLGNSGTRSLWYVDTGPILERDLAERAGLGFVGKHTNLINRRLGNWIFLA